MSIQEIGGKIKTFLQNDRLFYGLAFLLVAGISFGIGRLSLSPVSQSQKTAEIVQKIDTHASTQVATPFMASETAPLAPSTTSPTPAEVPTSGDARGAYVGSKNSDKYHLPWCGGAKRIAEANKVWFATKEEAEKAGYTPAGNCPGI